MIVGGYTESGGMWQHDRSRWWRHGACSVPAPGEWSRVYRRMPVICPYRVPARALTAAVSGQGDSAKGTAVNPSLTVITRLDPV